VAKSNAKDIRRAMMVAKANALGFDTSKKLYHGTNVPIEEFSAKRAPRDETMGLAGVHLAENPDFASLYASKPGGNILPVYARGKFLDATQLVKHGSDEHKILDQLLKGTGRKPYWSDDGNGNKSAPPLHSYIDSVGRPKAERIIRSAGYDGIKYNAKYGAVLPGGRAASVSSQSPSIVVFDPKNIRSSHASFEPDDNSSDLLRKRGGRASIPKLPPPGPGIARLQELAMGDGAMRKAFALGGLPAFDPQTLAAWRPPTSPTWAMGGADSWAPASTYPIHTPPPVTGTPATPGTGTGGMGGGNVTRGPNGWPMRDRPNRMPTTEPLNTPATTAATFPPTDNSGAFPGGAGASQGPGQSTSTGSYAGEIGQGGVTGPGGIGMSPGALGMGYGMATGQQMSPGFVGASLAGLATGPAGLATSLAGMGLNALGFRGSTDPHALSGNADSASDKGADKAGFAGMLGEPGTKDADVDSGSDAGGFGGMDSGMGMAGAGVSGTGNDPGGMYGGDMGGPGADMGGAAESDAGGSDSDGGGGGESEGGGGGDGEWRGGPVHRADGGEIAPGYVFDPAHIFGFADGGGVEKAMKLSRAYQDRMARAKEMGFTGPWYHGSSRIDRVVEAGRLNPKRATSGPMPYFTDDPQMASNYSTAKGDTSLAAADTGQTSDYFTVHPKAIGLSGRSPIPVERAWHFLPPEVKQEIARRALRIGYQNPQEATGELTLHPEGTMGSISGPDHYEYILKHHRGNHLAALRELWHDSGELIGNEAELAKVYQLAGFPAPIDQSNAPWTEAKGVMPAMLRMRKPLDTSNREYLQSVVIPHLDRAFKRDRTRTKSYGADMWDKNHRFTPKEWVAQLKEEVAAGRNPMVFTSIPDKVTEQLRALGHDGILDTGGKMGGQGHTVAIPFAPHQVRSQFANFDPAQMDSPDLGKSEGGAIDRALRLAYQAGKNSYVPSR